MSSLILSGIARTRDFGRTQSRSAAAVSLRTELFDYALPERLIAQIPAARRDQSRLLVVNRRPRTVAHHVFLDLPDFLRAGDILFRNNAAVLPARLFARRPTGGQVECFLLRPAGPVNEWWCLLRPGRKLPVGATFGREGGFTATVLAKEGDGAARVAFTTPGGESIVAVANRLGEVPLPPYIPRRRTGDERRLDLERYQTVYADRAHQVAVAAPTAGLHFTPELLAGLAAGGLRFADLTLHVGPGTFRPITAETIEQHVIHREVYELPPETQSLLFQPGGRRVAVGTTTVRSVEDFLSRHASPLDRPCLVETDLFIHPPRAFRGVDALITNFHQPRSTLLCLVAAFLTPDSTDGIAWIREIYAEAIAREYRFFSYGDAMLIL
jgi:S-adenosylmethionine:tRNA ribosyltransferase-isomerase